MQLKLENHTRVLFGNTNELRNSFYERMNFILEIKMATPSLNPIEQELLKKPYSWTGNGLTEVVKFRDQEAESIPASYASLSTFKEKLGFSNRKLLMNLYVSANLDKIIPKIVFTKVKYLLCVIPNHAYVSEFHIGLNIQYICNWLTNIHKLKVFTIYIPDDKYNHIIIVRNETPIEDMIRDFKNGVDEYYVRQPQPVGMHGRPIQKFAEGLFEKVLFRVKTSEELEYSSHSCQ